MSRLLPFFAFLALCGLFGFGIWWNSSHDQTAIPSPLINKPAPEFALPVLHEPGRVVTAKELRGQPYVLNVWGSWCPGCRDEHPVITRFAETKRVRVIGYNWKDDRTDALAWLEQFNNPYWLVLADEEGRTAIDFGIYGAPETFLVDGKGVIRWKFVGVMTDAIVRDQLLPALAAVERGE